MPRRLLFGRYQGESGHDSDIVKPTRLTRSGQKSLLQNALGKLALPGRLAKLCPRFCSSEVAMKCLRIYATPDGESHFGDADIPTTTMPLFPNEAAFQLCVSVSCMFQQ